MIDLRTALRTVAAQVWRLADEQDAANRGPRRADPAKLAARREAVQRLRGWARRIEEAASHAAGEADPAVVGYLCAWVRGDMVSLGAALEYLRRRDAPQWPRLRDADHSDKAASVLAALL